MDLKRKIGYCLFASYRRKLLDKLQFKYAYVYSGKVLDIGGRQRGLYCPPIDKVEWITADIEPERNPDLLLDVAKMDKIADASIDVINAIELFEHVEKIENGLRECHRILKKGGKMIISVPFLYPFHADPWDFQRWTEIKWEQELKQAGFNVEKIEIMGRFFTIFGDMAKSLVQSFPLFLRPFCYVFYPMLDVITYFDKLKPAKKSQFLSKYHGGYFIIASK